MSIKSKCKINTDNSVCLQDILNSFNSSIREEHAWALCYQCAKFFIETINVNRSNCFLVFDVNEVYLQSDGTVHPATLYGRGIEEEDINRKRLQNDIDLINGLGLVIFNALDQGNARSEERAISEDLGDLISDMITDDRTGIHEITVDHSRLNETDDRSGLHETDDEGIEKDSEEVFDEASTSNFTTKITLQQILQRCEKHLVTLTKSQAEIHYKAVVRAFVAEALELATFLEKVAQGASKLHGGTNQDLEQLQFADWARYWVQVIAELRLGVKLKKVHYTRAPIEYELTPYEILMKDIRSCRYSLRKIMVDGNPPSRVTKDAHAIILEFIKSRPPLKKVSDRKLAPYSRKLTPREQLMNSIRKGRTLRKTQTKPRYSLSPKTERNKQEFSDGEHKKRLIKVDFSQIHDDEDEDAQSDSSESAGGLWAQEEYRQIYGTALEAYDLALECPDARMNTRRSTLTVLQSNVGSHSVPQSRPCSRQSCESSDNESIIHLAPDLARALENPEKPWHESMPLDDLTLEEIVHIRTVLTKAELEALPVEGHVKSDAENRKVCFLCLKTRFGILGPWGNRCTICKRTVCSKCCSKMNIPMEHFSSVPVVLLSPSIMATPVDDNFPISKFTQQDSISTSNQSSPISNKSPSSIETAKKLRTKQTTSSLTSKSVVDRLKGSQMIVCQDCKMMVLQIIKSAQVNRAAIRNKTIQNLTLNLSPVF